ncbi:hypothetical protein [Aureimonas sp. SK2]|uniref:hypothetical protein n=1 Tax=Aureimonas sp. SK2 TaxID=3015992 RepID=UPI0024441EE7|nr:hypothetical protein [Aureimonas sp. SK2]
MSRPPRDIESLFGPQNLPAIDAMIEDALKDPAMSHWLRHALQGALKRDPEDAVYDAKVLLELLEIRRNAVILSYDGTVVDTQDPDEGR